MIKTYKKKHNILLYSHFHMWKEWCFKLTLDHFLYFLTVESLIIKYHVRAVGTLEIHNGFLDNAHSHYRKTVHFVISNGI
jgi:hypothetical protein